MRWLTRLTKMVGARATARSDLQVEQNLPELFVAPNIKSLAEIDEPGVAYESECVEIQGVISLSVQGYGSPGRNPGYKLHSFVLAAWCRLGEPVVERELVVLRPVPPETRVWNGFAAHSVVRFRALLSADHCRAVFERSLPVGVPDQGLAAIAAELQKPVVMYTKRFGDLVLDRSIDWFRGQAEWNGQIVRINFSLDKNRSIDDGLKTAELLWDDSLSWKRRIEAYAVEELLTLKNENWLEEGEAKLSADQFISRMTLESITVSSDGKFDFWHDDGDLFWGHSIQVSGNVTDGPSLADIPG